MARVCVFVWVCVCACARARARVCVCVCVHAQYSVSQLCRRTHTRARTQPRPLKQMLLVHQRAHVNSRSNSCLRALKHTHNAHTHLQIIVGWAVTNAAVPPALWLIRRHLRDPREEEIMQDSNTNTSARTHTHTHTHTAHKYCSTLLVRRRTYAHSRSHADIHTKKHTRAHTYRSLWGGR